MNKIVEFFRKLFAPRVYIKKEIIFNGVKSDFPELEETVDNIFKDFHNFMSQFDSNMNRLGHLMRK